MEIAATLIAMARADQNLRARLARGGVLFGGYHPEMRALHEKNADELLRIVEEIGWPNEEQVGCEASEAAWLIAQHAISRPHLMRAALAALQGRDDLDAKRRCAYLEDRIAVFEGRPQSFGTQLDWDDSGALVPAPIADPATVDVRRAAIGLKPLAEHVAAARNGATADRERTPADLADYRRAAAAFAVEVGWRAR